MATAEDIDAPLTLEIDGDAVSPEKFVRAVTAFFEVVREVSAAAAEGSAAAEWRVRVKQGSILVGAYPTQMVPQAAIDRILDDLGSGFARLEAEAVGPRAFSEKALRSLRALGQISGVSEADDTMVRVWIGKRPQPVTNRSVSHVSEILEASYEENGSVAGTLQTISDRGGLRFVIYERLWDRPVRCVIPEHLVEVALGAFRKTVEVYGTVRYRRDGVPQSVDVRDLEVMPDRDALPSYRDVYGILKNHG